MEQDKFHVLRKVLTIITIVMAFSLLGLMLISTQIKTVTFSYYGAEKTVMTLADTVDSFFIQNAINVYDKSEVYPEKQSKIENGMTIKVVSSDESAKIDIDSLKNNIPEVRASIEEVTEIIPFNTQKNETSALNRGVTTVVQEGVNGEKLIKYLVKYSGENEIYKAEVSNDIISEPVDEVLEVGTKIVTTVSRSSMPQTVNVDSGFRLYNIPLSEAEQKFAYSLCQQYGLEYELFLAVIRQESNFIPTVVGGGNSYGLCQIHVSNHATLRNKLGVNDFFDPYDNMTAGAYMLSYYFNIARNKVSDPVEVEVYALNAYNMGEGAYYSMCYSNGILHRGYSNSVRSIRDRLKQNGGL